MAANGNLNKAKKEKNDDFYTQLSDIEKELQHYKEHFRGKVVYCNCDDPTISNFFRYFYNQFERLGLKKLITTCYKNRPLANLNEKAIKTEYDGKIKNVIELEGDGDFRSEECINILKQADIVITNPPFSLFREYIDQLIKHGKKFLIIGSAGAVIYKNVFSYLQENKLWTGYTTGSIIFIVPDIKGGYYRKNVNVSWYTNLYCANRDKDLPLHKKYTPEEYPMFDNNDPRGKNYGNVISVKRVKDIPMDYAGAMGVPITFMTKHNPDQFELLASDRPFLNGKPLYMRFIIRNRRLNNK